MSTDSDTPDEESTEEESTEEEPADEPVDEPTTDPAADVAAPSDGQAAAAQPPAGQPAQVAGDPVEYDEAHCMRCDEVVDLVVVATDSGLAPAYECACTQHLLDIFWDHQASLVSFQPREGRVKESDVGTPPQWQPTE